MGRSTTSAQESFAVVGCSVSKACGGQPRPQRCLGDGPSSRGLSRILGARARTREGTREEVEELDCCWPLGPSRRSSQSGGCFVACLLSLPNAARPCRVTVRFGPSAANMVASLVALSFRTGSSAAGGGICGMAAKLTHPGRRLHSVCHVVDGLHSSTCGTGGGTPRDLPCTYPPVGGVRAGHTLFLLHPSTSHHPSAANIAHQKRKMSPSAWHQDAHEPSLQDQTLLLLGSQLNRPGAQTPTKRTTHSQDMIFEPCLDGLVNKKHKNRALVRSRAACRSAVD
jgi:hypothetical protein